MSAILIGCLVVAGILLLITLGTILFWFDYNKTIRFIKSAKQSTIEEIVE